MDIICLGGVSGSGKKIIAALTAAELNSQGYTVKLDSFAKPMKDRLRERAGRIDREEDRGWLQDLGEEIRLGDHDAFVRDLIHRNRLDACIWRESKEIVGDTDFLIITDVKYVNEALFCNRIGVLWFSAGSHNPLPHSESAHISEQQAAAVREYADVVIPKQPSLSMLEKYIQTLIADGAHLK